MRTGQRRYKPMVWRRMIATQESRALRCLYREYGRLPTVTTTSWDTA